MLFRSLSNLLWASRAAKHLDGYDQSAWSARLNSAISQAESRALRGNAKVTWMDVAGALRLAAGQIDAGTRQLRDALLLPDGPESVELVEVAADVATEISADVPVDVSVE